MSAPGADDTPPQNSPIKEALIVYGAVFLMVLALALAGQLSGFVHANLYLLVAFVFMGVPMVWMQRKRLSQERFGMSTQGLWRHVGVGLLASVLTFGPFVAGQYIWETEAVGRTFAFDVDNWFTWPMELEGEPTQWGKEPGAWVWVEEDTLHIGLRAEERVRGAVRLSADTAFTPKIEGNGASLRAVDAKGKKRTSRTPAKQWELIPVLYGRPIEVALQEVPAERLPRTVEISTVRVDGYEDDPFALRLGAGARQAPEQSEEVTRGVMWILMWLITQLFFIALPEEYFYRGYLQTRLKDGFEWRGTPSLWFVTPQNLVTSLLFGLGHLLIPVGGVLLPGRFSVFFPSLIFGFLRERTGSITASVVYHTSCNMMVLVWVVHYH